MQITKHTLQEFLDWMTPTGVSKIIIHRIMMGRLNGRVDEKFRHELARHYFALLDDLPDAKYNMMVFLFPGIEKQFKA